MQAQSVEAQRRLAEARQAAAGAGAGSGSGREAASKLVQPKGSRVAAQGGLVPIEEATTGSEESLNQETLAALQVRCATW